MSQQLKCVFLGLSITSTWGNGHATTYRGLLKELAARGHSVTFLERDVPWYAENREFDSAPYCAIELYSSLDELKDRFGVMIRDADVVVVGSYVPEGVRVGEWVNFAASNCVAFYDIDTPVTLANLASGACEYLSRELIRRYDLYLSFTGGPTLEHIERRLGARRARALYCSVDPALYYPEPRASRWDLAYLGTYAPDRQPALDRLLLDVARQNPANRFVVAGPQYPEMEWPPNVERFEHVPACEHRDFYNSQKFALNLTRADMVRAGYSPSVRLFEAAACGVPILTDEWPGLASFFTPQSEILPVRTGKDVTSYLQMPEERRFEIGHNARRRALRLHTAAVRAAEFETYVIETLEELSSARKQRRIATKQSPSAALI